MTDVFGFSDKGFYKKMMKLSLPIMVQQFIATAMYMVDTVMISGLGDIELAGVGAANQITYLLDICLFGITAGGSVFIAQHFGNDNIKKVRSTMGLCMALAGALTVLFFFVSQFFGQSLVWLFADEVPVAASGFEYLRYASYGYIFKAVISPLSITHKASGRPRLPMYTGIAGLLTNMFLNYCLIFGNFGFPMLGVKGAAIATIIGSSVDAFSLIILTYAKECAARARLKELFSDIFQDISDFIRISLPVLIDDAAWAVGMLMQNAIYGKMGTETFAAMMIIGTVDKLAFVMMQALGTSTAVFVGNTLGAGDKQRARTYGHRFLWLSLLVGVFLTVVIATAGRLIPGLYINTSVMARSLASDTIMVMALMMTSSAINFNILVGVLRCGGDTKVAAYIDLLPLFLIALPLSYLTGIVFELSLPIVYACQLLASCVRFVFAIRRVKDGLWLNTLV